jgi:hypothetical protein
MVLRSATTASSSATSGQSASKLPAAFGEGAVTCTGSVPRKGIHLPPQHAATAGWRKEQNPSRQLSGLQTHEGDVEKSRRGHPGLQREGCSLPTTPLQACPSRRRSQVGQRNSRASNTSGGSGRSRHNAAQVPVALPQHEQQTTGQSVRVPNVNCPATMESRSLWPCPNTNTRQQVSKFGPLM